MKGERDRSRRLSCQVGNQPANNERLIGEIAARQHGVLSSAQTPGGGHLEGRGFQASQGRAPAPHSSRGLRGGTCPTQLRRPLCGGRPCPRYPRCGQPPERCRRVENAKAHSGPIDVTVPGDGGREKRRGIRIHRSHSVTVGVTTRRNGIAVAKPGRTLRDLHRTSPQPVFRRALRRALDLRLVSSADVRRVAHLTRSELERIWWTDLPSLRPCTPCSA